jgi:hypothetical protein
VDSGNPFFGPPRCATAGVAFCDDFESGALNLGVWTTELSSGTVTVDTIHAARGTHAVHVHTPAGNRNSMTALFGETLTFPAAADSFYARAFVYIQTVPVGYASLLEALGNAPIHTEYHATADGPNLGASYWRDPSTNWSTTSTTLLPIGRWFCLEWHVRGDTGQASTWIDEVPITDLDVNNWTPPTFERLKLGVQYQASFDAWYDEVAVDPSRIGCTR